MLGLKEKYESLPWLEDTRRQLEELVDAGRCPHALLLQGRAGMGRRQLALWLAARVLGADPSRPLQDNPDSEAGHPDFVTLEIPDDKTQIVVDQSRDLIAFLQLTSHGGRGRVAVIYPAEAMNRNTANALLKTLEEPPAGTVIVLIAESPRSLPPTILSRCQQIRLAPPPPSEVVDWLAERAGGKDLTNMLDFVGGAPLAALELHEAEFAETANGFAADLRQLEAREVSPTLVAARWAKQPDLALQWLYWRLSRRVRQALEAKAGNGLGGDQALRVTQACFQQMGQIRELRQLIKRGISAELNLVGLLMDWYGGLGSQSNAG